MRLFQDLIEKTRKQRRQDKEMWHKLPDSYCQICGSDGQDRRTLLINVGYELKEVSLKFFDLFLLFNNPMYGLRMCKGCRSAFMMKLREWIQEKGRLRFTNLDEDGILSSSTWPVTPKKKQ